MESESVNPQNFQKSALIVGVSLVLGLTFNFLFYEKIPGVGFLVYVLLAIAGLFIVAGAVGMKLSSDIRWLLIPAIFFSLMVAVRANVMLIFMNIIGVMLLLLLIASLSQGDRLRDYVIADYLKVLFLPFLLLGSLFGPNSAFTSLCSAKNNREVMPHVGRGIAISIPVLIIFRSSFLPPTWFSRSTSMKYLISPLM